MIDVHPWPEEARCDGPQALLPEALIRLGAQLHELARWTGRRMPEGQAQTVGAVNCGGTCYTGDRAPEVGAA
jgi:hypothetical protein